MPNQPAADMGRVTLRMSLTLIDRLTRRARAEGVDVSTLARKLITLGLDHATPTQPGRSRP